MKQIIPTNLLFFYFYLLCYDDFPNRSVMVGLMTTNGSGSTRTISLHLQAGTDGFSSVLMCVNSCTAHWQSPRVCWNENKTKIMLDEMTYFISHFKKTPTNYQDYCKEIVGKRIFFPICSSFFFSERDLLSLATDWSQSFSLHCSYVAMYIVL